MAMAANSDVRRLYSWWWDSHISRKNSKWLEENLRDMDMKVSMMIRLLEEDGDSFARKAEMYFKKRPELLKLVEEFYRAYRALAERYDHATVALRQAHRTIQEAFPNQVPSTPSDASNSVSSEPQTPDDPPKEAFDSEMPNFVSIKSNGKARKVLNFLEEEGKGYNGSDFSLKKEMGNGDDIEEEIAIVECQKLSEKISNLELEISRAREENEKIKSELERCLIFEEEVNTLTKQMNERGEEIETLKLKSKETELNNHSLAEDFDKVKENNEDLRKELISTREELKEERFLKVKVEEALKSSEKLNLRYQEEIKVLFSDLQSKAETLNDFEGMNHDLEDKVEKLKEENESLNTEILSSTSTIKNLQDEISTLEETRVRLEDEAQERENEKAALQQKVRVFQDEIADLEVKLKCIIDQIEGIGLSEESFQVSVSEMQRENRELKESCEKYEDEKVFLLGNLEEVNKKSAYLEKSLLQVTDELQGLEANARSLEDSCDSLNRRIRELSTENGILADQMEISLKNASVEIGELKEKIQSLNQTHEDEKAVLLQNTDRETEKGVLLEISLSKTSAELEREREVARSLEESCATLNNRVQELISENESLSQRFNVCAQSLSNAHKDTEVLRQKLESMNLELEGLQVSFIDKEAVLIGQLETAAEERTCVEKSLSETTSQLESLILKERSLEESFDSLKRRMEDIIAENGNLENSLKDANELINELRETKAALLDQSEKERENRMSLEKALSETRSELDGKRESCESLNIRIQELSMENVSLSQRLIFSTRSMEDVSKNNALLESSLSNANGEIEGLREKIQNMREKEAVLIVQLEDADGKKNVLEKSFFESTSEVERLKMKKRSLEEFCDSLNTKITEVTAKNSSLLENNATLDRSLSDALIEVEVLRKKVQSLDESFKSLNEENSNLLSEKISLTSELENSCSSAKKATERFMGLEEKHLNLERERKSTLLLVGELKSLLTLSHQELARLSEEHLDLQISYFIFERQLLHAAESFQKLLNLFSDIKRDNLEQEKVMNSISVHNKNLQNGIQTALETLGIKSSSKDDELNFQSIITEFKEIKRILSDIIDDNFSLVLGDTVKSTLMREMGLDLVHLKSENSEMAEQLLALKIEKGELGLDLVQFKSENVKIAEQMLTLKRENDVLGLDLMHVKSENSEMAEQLLSLKRAKDELSVDLMQFKSENSEMVEKLLTLKGEKDELGLELLHLQSENSEMADQLLILKGEKHELLQSNEELIRVLNESQKRENQLMADLCALENVLSDHRDQIKNLEEENTSSLLEALNLSFLSLLFEQLAAEREMLLKESAQKSALLETQNGVLTDLVNSLNQQVEIGRNLSSHKDLELAEALQRFKVSEDTMRAKLKDSLFLIEESDSKIRELMDEIGFYENEASKLWCDTQVSEVYVQIFEDKIHELMEQCGNLKKRVIAVQKGSDSLESELTAYLPLVLIVQESMRCLEKEILSLMKMYGMKGESEQETSSTKSELAVIDHPSEQNLNGFLGLQKLQLQIKSLQELIKSSVSSTSENKNKDIAPVFTSLVSQQAQESGQDSTNGDGLIVNSTLVRENLESEDQMLRLWETAERETGLISSELMREKSGVDQTGIPGKVSSRRDWSRRISDRLSADAQRLLTLQKSIEELKTQLEKSLTLVDKSTELKYVAVIGRLKRFDEEISELVKANADSARRAEAVTGGAVDGKKQVVEEVQSGAEKIGKLEMELQKIHYVVLKVNEERETKVKGGRKRSRTVLRDYLYGRGKGPKERRWGICTGCIRSNAVRN